MVLKWVPIHELTLLAGDDGRCFLCRAAATYKFEFFHNTTRESRWYCEEHARRAAKRHHIPMPMRPAITEDVANAITDTAESATK